MLRIIFTAILTFSALYAPQPLLPVIARDLAVSRETAALLITVTFVPLSIAPLLYGYILETVSPRRMLRWAVLLLALSEAGMVFTAGFPALLVVRLLQGLLIPAIMTALMTCSAQTARQGEVQRAMAIYIAATIVGGFLGRACSGIIATLLGWRFSFAILGISLLACFFILGGLVAPAQLNLIRPRPRMILEALGERPLLRLLLGVFCLFLVFAAIMNFIPFRLTELSPLADEMRIGLIYSGYMAGLASSLGAASLARYVGGERRLLLIAWSVYGLSLSLLALPRVELLFAAMFIFCAAMFAIHATASGLANRNTKSGKGVVNGLYVSFYYAGGVVGSWLPGVAYHHGGWNLLLLSLGGVVAAGMIFMCRVEIPGN